MRDALTLAGGTPADRLTLADGLAPSAVRWRLKAEECRALAWQMNEQVAREAFLRLADGYAHRAMQLEEQALKQALDAERAA
jgi:hypothetical protein